MDAAPTDWPSNLAPQLRLDPRSAMDRLLVARLGDVLAAIPAESLIRPVVPSTAASYDGVVLNLRRWCAHEGWIEAGTALEDQPLELLRPAVEEWLAWRAMEAPLDHPLTTTGAVARGERTLGCRRPEGHKRLGRLRAAVSRWALTHGLGDPLTGRARLISGAAAPVLPARALTDDEYTRVVLALAEGSVTDLGDATRTTAWHLRQLAAVNIVVAASLRGTAELPMLRDDNVVDIGPDGIGIRFPRTKLNVDGRQVLLRPRPDWACPVWALHRWLRFCADQGWSRGGLLLPAVNYAYRVQPLYEPRGRSVIRAPWRIITDALDITTDSSPLVATPHGLRAMAPTRAGAAGWDRWDLMALGGWQDVRSALRYDHSGAPTQLVQAMAQGLADEHAA